VVGWAAAKARLNFDTAQIHKEESEKRLISMAEIGKEQAQIHKELIDAINDRFKVLIDGYEKRIEDLTQEVHGLRDEVHRLRLFIDERLLGVPHASAAPPQS
jgi:Mg2+ and Co2+ transporter CorA